MFYGNTARNNCVNSTMAFGKATIGYILRNSRAEFHFSLVKLLNVLLNTHRKRMFVRCYNKTG